MSYKSFVKFIEKQNNKNNKQKTDLKKGEDIFGLGNKKSFLPKDYKTPLNKIELREAKINNELDYLSEQKNKALDQCQL